jgi:DNA replication protein DnaC
VAEAESLSFEQYLLAVLERECETRRTNRIGRLLKESGLPLEKTMAMFDRTRLPHALNAQVTTLLDGTFLDRKENVLAFGKSGSGKSHLLCAIAHELIQKERRVRFVTTSLLVQELLAAKRDLRLARALKRLSRYEALFIDDIGYVQQDRDEMEVLFTLLAERYERGSVMITSNLPFSRWEEIFKDPTTTAAAIDRLVHHSIIIELNLESYRLEESRKNRKATQEGVKAPEPGTTPTASHPRQRDSPQTEAKDGKEKPEKGKDEEKQQQKLKPKPHRTGD